MYERFSFRSSDADALVFKHTSESAHCMTLEMGEIYKEIVIGQMTSDTIILEVFCIRYRQVDISVCIHYINFSDVAIAALFYRTAMGRCV